MGNVGQRNCVKMFVVVLCSYALRQIVLGGLVRRNAGECVMGITTLLIVSAYIYNALFMAKGFVITQ